MPDGLDASGLANKGAPGRGARRAPSSASTSRVARKRTKTGCLTCRRRRIKCGEEKPVCTNCIKSKRHCDGYNQRVIFKPPTINTEHVGHGGIPLNPGLPMHLSAPVLMEPNVRFGEAFRHHVPVPAIAGWDSTAYQPGYALQYHGQHVETPSTAISSAYLNQPRDQRYEQPALRHYDYAAGSFVPLSSSSRENGSDASSAPRTQFPAWDPHRNPYSSASQGHPSDMATPHPPQLEYRNPQRSRESASYSHGWSDDPGRPLSEECPPQESFAAYQRRNTMPAKTHATLNPPSEASCPPLEHPTIRPIESWQFDVQQLNSTRSNQYHHPRPPQSLNTPVGSVTGAPVGADLRHSNAHPHLHQTLPSSRMLGYENVSAADMLEQAAVEYEDDDYYDVESDEDASIGPTQSLSHVHHSQRDLGMILALHQASADDMSIRRYDRYLDTGSLDSYRAERVANPLKNPHTARVFAHFIAATGPSLSVFERHPRNTSAIFHESPVPSAQQSLWSYTLPMLALHHQGLLHAMLAISSLHMAKLKGASKTPSLKHYAYSLKRVHRCVAQPQKRHQVTTLAATLLLGFYEVFSAEHIKWSTHLHGAKQLVVEIDYAGMAAEIKALKLRRPYDRDRHSNGFYDTAARRDMVMHPLATSFVDEIPNVDERLVGVLTGKDSRHDYDGRVFDEHEPQRVKSSFDIADLRNFAIYQDLYWWYCKQDIIQCLISGNRLLMNYDQFANCPPRAPIGKGDAVYGSSDHLSLLLARIGDFAARDRARKIRAVAASGGTWRPPTNLGASTPPGSRFSQDSTATMARAPPSAGLQTAPPSVPPSHQSMRSTPMQPPPFYGMAPAPAHRHMPSAFVPDYQSSSPSSTVSQEIELETATRDAEEEWNQIRAALTVFDESLGPDFQPLPAEIDQPFMTPFGHARHYRSYDISCLWLWYYVGLIVCIRAHPSMPPAMNMAAGVAARQTAEHAMEIGRIAAGLGPTSNLATVSPSVGASFIESSVALFCAGVQYQDMGQRAWALSRLRDIETSTGWATAGVIAGGLESGWEKAAAAGRGAPYIRVRDVSHSDGRVSGKAYQPTAISPEEPTDRRFVHINPHTRMYWAIGVLGEQEELVKDINDLTIH